MGDFNPEEVPDGGVGSEHGKLPGELVFTFNRGHVKSGGGVGVFGLAEGLDGADEAPGAIQEFRNEVLARTELDSSNNEDHRLEVPVGVLKNLFSDENPKFDNLRSEMLSLMADQVGNGINHAAMPLQILGRLIEAKRVESVRDKLMQLQLLVQVSKDVEVVGEIGSELVGFRDRMSKDEVLSKKVAGSYDTLRKRVFDSRDMFRKVKELVADRQDELSDVVGKELVTDTMEMLAVAVPEESDSGE